MSIVIEYYPDHSTKSTLVDFFRKEGCVPCSYIMSPFPENSVYLSWYNESNFESYDGVEIVIYQSEEKRWFVFTRTRVSASAYDKLKQNELIKKAKKEFGGYFINDCYGKNRYIPIDSSEFLTPIQSGAFQLFEHVNDQIEKLAFSVNNVKEFEINVNQHPDLIKLLKQINPIIVLYNSLIPFLVSAIEHFFKELFIIMVQYDKIGKEVIRNVRIKDIREITTVNDIQNITIKETSIERLLANTYNFQNLDKINATFGSFFQMDIKSILYVKKRVYGKYIIVYKELNQLIQLRHIIIHEFGTVDIDKSTYLYYIDLTKKIINLIGKELTIREGKKFLENSHYFV